MRAETQALVDEIVGLKDVTHAALALLDKYSGMVTEAIDKAKSADEALAEVRNVVSDVKSFRAEVADALVRDTIADPSAPPAPVPDPAPAPAPAPEPAPAPTT